MYFIGKKGHSKKGHYDDEHKGHKGKVKNTVKVLHYDVNEY